MIMPNANQGGLDALDDGAQLSCVGKVLPARLQDHDLSALLVPNRDIHAIVVDFSQPLLPLAPRPTTPPPVHIALHDGHVTVNGAKVSIPVGTQGQMLARDFKRLAHIYPGNALFVERDGSSQRMRDSDVVGFVPGAAFTHSRPVVRSVPRWHRD